MIREALIRRAVRTPYFDIPGYLLRFWLVPYRRSDEPGCGPVSPWRRPIAFGLQLVDIAARIHAILRSDREHAPHSHPWAYLTVILFGGYWEERYDDDGMCISRRWHGPGSILWRPAGSWHRLDLPPGTTTWTLFITFKKQGSWFFNVNGVKVPWRDYLKEHKQ